MSVFDNIFDTINSFIEIKEIFFFLADVSPSCNIYKQAPHMTFSTPVTLINPSLRFIYDINY